jgi:tetratricopeptide (TPR) repeat protein
VSRGDGPLRRSAALAHPGPSAPPDALLASLREGRHAQAYAGFDALFAASRPAAFRALRDIWLEGSLGELSRAPASPWTELLLGSQEWRGVRDLAALKHLARAAAAPGFSWARYYVAEVLLRRLDLYALARRELDALHASDPWLWEARCLRAETLAALGAPAVADPSSRGVPAASRPAFLAWRGAIKLWTGRPAKALADLDEAARLGNLDARGWRGGACVLLGRPSAALPELGAVLADDPRDPEALVWRGEAFRLLGRRREARADLDAALALSDASVWALANRALLGLDEGDEAGARRDFARLAPARYRDVPDDGSGVDRGSYVYEEPDLPAERLRALLEEALKAARGCRRFDAHLNAGWMRAAGAPVPPRPAPGSRLLYWLRFKGAPAPPETVFGAGAVSEAEAAAVISGATAAATSRTSRA